MTQQKPTLGNAIDQLIAILEPLDDSVRAVAITTACTVLKIALNGAGTTSGVSQGATAPPPAIQTNQSDSSGEVSSKSRTTKWRDIRSLKDAKQPRSAKEMACLVAFYLQEVAPEQERKETIAADDLEKYFKQANFKLPKVMQQVLPDAKASGYFDSPTRGAYKLNAVGYNLVAHKLPSSESAT